MQDRELACQDVVPDGVSQQRTNRGGGAAQPAVAFLGAGAGQQRLKQLPHDAKGVFSFQLRAPPGQQPQAGSQRRGAGMPQQPGLAQSRRAGDHDGAAGSARYAAHSSIQRGPLGMVWRMKQRAGRSRPGR